MDPQSQPAPRPSETPPHAAAMNSPGPAMPPPGYRPPPPPPGPPIVIQSNESWFGRWFMRLGWMGFFFCGMLLIGQQITLHEYFDTSGGIQEKFHSGEKEHFVEDKVAIIDISGVIMDGDGFVKRQIDRIRDDEHVRAVVVRVNSPGGAVSGADFIFHHLKKLRKEKNVPMVVSMGGMAASGGYYVSMAVGDREKTIFAEPTTTTGSIGVIMPHYDISGLLERFDIKDDSISSHPRKQMLSMTKKLSEDDRQILNAYINEAFTRFTDIIKEGRPVFEKDEDALRQLATGELFSATQAKKHGLVDEIGFLEDAIDRAVELAGLQKTKVRVVKYERPMALFDLNALSQSKSQVAEIKSLLELSAPRAYYLSTSLSGLVSSSKAD